MSRTVPPNPKEYYYSYPDSLIAQVPAAPRDSARLLVYERANHEVTFDTFKNLAKYLPPRAVLVFNQTKVVPARLYVTKSTGGRVELLYLGKTRTTFSALANKSLKAGDVLKLDVGGAHIDLTVTVTKKLSKGYEFKPSFPITDLFSVLDAYGATPIPPYIKHTTLSEKKLRSEYQTVFAKEQGSSAAPTASLHFTNRLMHSLEKSGISIEYLTLHVGLGTFAPLTEAQLTSGKLHKEWYEISSTTAKRLKHYQKQERPIIAVGTTAARALESACQSGSFKKLTGETDLFIYPPYNFKCINGLITNFHVPESSLMMLVASLTGREQLLSLYKKAIQKKFRLFSFGDGMLIT